MAGSPYPEGATTQVWVFDEHPGYRRAIEGAGTVAAPLLAGFALTLLLLLVSGFSTSAEGSGGKHTHHISSGLEQFAALPKLAAVLFAVASLFFIAAVQAAISARYHGHSPADLQALYPEYFPEACNDGEEPPEAAKELSGWESEEWPAMKAGQSWVAGWVREYFYEEIWLANRWAGATRGLYDLGILALLAGLTALLAPPGSAYTFWRWALFGVALVGVVGEVAWTVSQSKLWNWLRDRDG